MSTFQCEPGGLCGFGEPGGLCGFGEPGGLCGFGEPGKTLRFRRVAFKPAGGGASY